MYLNTKNVAVGFVLNRFVVHQISYFIVKDKQHFLEINWIDARKTEFFSHRQ